MSYIPNPPDLPYKEGIRRVYFSGHQICYEAYFHGWTKTEDQMKAVLEHKDGRINFEHQLNGLTFIDK